MSDPDALKTTSEGHGVDSTMRVLPTLLLKALLRACTRKIASGDSTSINVRFVALSGPTSDTFRRSGKMPQTDSSGRHELRQMGIEPLQHIDLDLLTTEVVQRLVARSIVEDM